MPRRFDNVVEQAGGHLPARGAVGRLGRLRCCRLSSHFIACTALATVPVRKRNTNTVISNAQASRAVGVADEVGPSTSSRAASMTGIGSPVLIDRPISEHSLVSEKMPQIMETYKHKLESLASAVAHR